jgi:hypothetical protein
VGCTGGGISGIGTPFYKMAAAKALEDGIYESSMRMIIGYQDCCGGMTQGADASACSRDPRLDARPRLIDKDSNLHVSFN